MALRPFQILLFAFVTVHILPTALLAQEGKPELPAELKEKIDDLIEKLGDDEYAVREAAHAKIATLLTDTKTFDALLPYLKRQMETTQDFEVRVRLRRVTRHYVDFGITSSLLEKFPDIIGRLTSPDREVRLQMLRELTDVKAVEPLIKALGDTNHWVRSEAALALGNIKAGRAVDPLINALQDGKAQVRQDAAYALGQVNDARSVEPLIKALCDEDPDVRGEAAFALGSIKDTRAVEPLIKALRDTDDFVRGWAAHALSYIKDAKAVEPLIKALDNEEAWLVRWAMAYALGEIKDTRALEPLIKALGDEHKCVAEVAQDALGKMGKPALDSLKAALDKETDETIKAKLKEIIEKITK